MNRTSNYNLGLWEGSDFPNYTMPNENMNIIDTNLKVIEERSTESLSKANSAIERLGDSNIEQMESDINRNTATVDAHTAQINKIQNDFNTVVSTTKTEYGTRVVREVTTNFSDHSKINYIEGIFFYNATVEITPDRLGLDGDAEIKVISVNGVTEYKPQLSKGNYTVPVNYVGKNDNGNYCFCANGSAPSTNTVTDVTFLNPTGFIIEFIKL